MIGSGSARSALAALLIVCGANRVLGQEPLILGSRCSDQDTAPFCQAIHGDRAEGWPIQGRSEVMARHGMVTSSQPLATQAGLQVLRQGGNAIDAAVATAATLSVVEPMMVGVAGDLFAVVYIAKDHKTYVLNASGMAPTGATLERFDSLGYRADPANWGPGSGMPVHGILPVTVPGTVWGWDALLTRFGTMTFRDLLEPAARYAEEGFPISERIANDWHSLPAALPLKGCCTETDPESVRVWMPGGHPPRPGQIFRNPDLAKTLRLLEAEGVKTFYHGEIARAIVAKSTALGGTMTLDDLAGYRGEWVEPAKSEYRGYTLYELPPPSMGWAASEILNILESCVPVWAPGQSLASLGPANAKYWHLLVEAKKLAYRDLYRFNGDPDFVKVPLDRLLSKSYAASLCGQVDPSHAADTGPRGTGDNLGDTVVLSTADKDGNMVSWVNSNYDLFGSGLTVPGYGFVLHDRGALFSLDPKSPDAIAPHKRPFNTLSAGLLTDAVGKMRMTVTLMGGDMQAQGHAQLLVDVIDLGANLQAATEMARFRHSQVPNELSLEAALYDRVGPELLAMGHKLKRVTGEGIGGVQSILFSGQDGQEFFRGGSDSRKDGQAAGW
jgi:gamma-glutamyltranspeptidase/glutathione hydrolase